MGRGPAPWRAGSPALSTPPSPGPCVCGITGRFPPLSPSRGSVTHVFLTRPPLARGVAPPGALDLHALSPPPAFVLSQDQTLPPHAAPPPGGRRSTLFRITDCSVVKDRGQNFAPLCRCCRPRGARTTILPRSGVANLDGATVSDIVRHQICEARACADMHRFWRKRAVFGVVAALLQSLL